jgi:hypothetical protein
MAGALTTARLGRVGSIPKTRAVVGRRGGLPPLATHDRTTHWVIHSHGGFDRNNEVRADVVFIIDHSVAMSRVGASDLQRLDVGCVSLSRRHLEGQARSAWPATMPNAQVGVCIGSNDRGIGARWGAGVVAPAFAAPTKSPSASGATTAIRSRRQSRPNSAGYGATATAAAGPGRCGVVAGSPRPCLADRPPRRREPH